MSIADPLQWLKDHHPGEHYNELTLCLTEGVPQFPGGTFIAGVFDLDRKHSLKAVIDWLEHSPIYIWPYADIDYGAGAIDQRINNVMLTLKIDYAVLDALHVSGNTTSTSYHLAANTAVTLKTLADHVYDHTKTRIVINDAK